MLRWTGMSLVVKCVRCSLLFTMTQVPNFINLLLQIREVSKWSLNTFSPTQLSSNKLPQVGRKQRCKILLNPTVCGLNTSHDGYIDAQVSHMSMSPSCFAEKNLKLTTAVLSNMLIGIYYKFFADWRGIHRCSQLFWVNICYRERAQTWQVCLLQRTEESLGLLSWIQCLW